jgi:hypothetical protein
MMLRHPLFWLMVPDALAGPAHMGHGAVLSAGASDRGQGMGTCAEFVALMPLFIGSS